MADKKQQSHIGAIAAGLAGITAAAVGAYYLYGSKDAKKNRAKVKGWMLKAKGEVIEQLENVQDVTEGAYMSAVDAVAKRYNDLKQIDPAELEAFIGEMREHWDGIKRTVNARVKKPAAKKRAASGSKAKAKKPRGKNGAAR